MKLIFAVVHDEDVAKIIEAFSENNLKITKVYTAGGFTKSGNTTLIAGVEDDMLQKAVNIIENNSESRQETVKRSVRKRRNSGLGEYELSKILFGKATIFITEVEKYVKY